MVLPVKFTRDKIATKDPEMSGDFGKLMDLAEKHTKMSVRTNADHSKDSEVARKFGAKGIGLCRTEHMFFEGDRIIAMREMILAEDEAGRRKALEKLLPIQRADFEGIFEAMHDLPVTVRLLDPPLHEFVPHEEENQKEMADEMGITVEEIKTRWKTCMSSIPCWDTGDAAWAIPILRFQRCRPGPSLKLHLT